MISKQKNMRQILVFFAIAIVAIAGIPLILNWVLSSNCGFISTGFQSADWLSFWATYLTGLFAIIVGYCAITSSNKNSEAAILQQTNLMKKQETDRITAEIMDEIKKQIMLFNVPDLCYPIEAFDEGKMFGLKEHIQKVRAALYESQIGWNFTKTQYLDSSSLCGVTQMYDVCWQRTVMNLNELLSLQMDFLRKVEEVRNFISQIGGYEKMISLLNEKIKLSQKQDSSILEEIDSYTKMKCNAEQKRDAGNQCISDTVKAFHEKVHSLEKLQNELFVASTAFLSELKKNRL